MEQFCKPTLDSQLILKASFNRRSVYMFQRRRKIGVAGAAAVAALYQFGGNSETNVMVNYALSSADAPKYGNGGKTVVINFKGYLMGCMQ